MTHASGSAHLRLANTDVLVGVKAELSPPLPDRPDEGKFDLTIYKHRYTVVGNPEGVGVLGVLVKLFLEGYQKIFQILPPSPVCIYVYKISSVTELKITVVQFNP